MAVVTKGIPFRGYAYRLVFLMIAAFAVGCGSNVTETGETTHRISAVLDSFHVAASRADYVAYFEHFAEDAVFIGTDATERWDKQSFMVWAKPYFDRGRAWSFRAVERHVMLDEHGTIAWFDELLDTQMKLCRGSGVLVLRDGAWKVRHYVLSMTIPNEVTDSVVAIKSVNEDGLMQKYTTEKEQEHSGR